jgi:hypothetical protein
VIAGEIAPPGMYEDIRRAIRQREASVILQAMFEGRPTRLTDGSKTENELWDLKADCPRVGSDLAAAPVRNPRGALG